MEREINENIQLGLKTWMPDLNKFFDGLEPKLESELIELFSKVGITSMVKADRVSLPYQGEVIIKLPRESYINGMFERDRIFRPIIKEMLGKDAYKIRFYIHAETYGGDEKYLLGLMRSGFKYSFRYYIHKSNW